MSSNRKLFRPFILIFLFSFAAVGGPRDSRAGELVATWSDNSGDEDGFVIERRGDASPMFAPIAVVPANVTSYDDLGLVDGEIYCYRVLAFNAAGSSAYSNENCAPARPSAYSGLLAAVLPSSRSVQVGVPATAFVTVINLGSNTATSCGIGLLTNVPVVSSFQTTDPLTNQLTATPNLPVDISPGGAQTFMVAFTPTAPFLPTDVQMRFYCGNTDPAPINFGVDTLLLSASATPVPDIVALGATMSNDGIVNIPEANGTGAFAVATINAGEGGSITVSADTGTASLPVSLFLCETNPATGVCISAIGASVTRPIDINATPTFAIFVQGHGPVPFNPATNRIFVRFTDGSNVTRGATSVAVRTQ